MLYYLLIIATYWLILNFKYIDSIIYQGDKYYKCKTVIKQDTINYKYGRIEVITTKTIMYDAIKCND